MKLCTQQGRNDMRATINNINSIIKYAGFEIVRGQDYFYFSPTHDKSPYISQEGVYVHTLGQWTAEEWAQILFDRIKEDNRYKDDSDNLFIIQ